MAPDKVTKMILDVDFKCSCCYNKVKKVLCKFPQIRDQVFDAEKNKVLIKVVCCDPEKFRDKLCCKGGKVIQRIEIVEDKPKPPEPPKEPETQNPVKKPDPPPDVVPTPKPVPLPPENPVSVCCRECKEGRGGGPCHYGHGRPVPPPPGPCYDVYIYQYGGNMACYVSRWDCFSEENPQGCSIM